MFFDKKIFFLKKSENLEKNTPKIKKKIGGGIFLNFFPKPFENPMTPWILYHPPSK